MKKLKKIRRPRLELNSSPPKPTRPKKAPEPDYVKPAFEGLCKSTFNKLRFDDKDREVLLKAQSFMRVQLSDNQFKLEPGWQEEKFIRETLESYIDNLRMVESAKRKEARKATQEADAAKHHSEFLDFAFRPLMKKREFDLDWMDQEIKDKTNPVRLRRALRIYQFLVEHAPAWMQAKELQAQLKLPETFKTLNHKHVPKYHQLVVPRKVMPVALQAIGITEQSFQGYIRRMARNGWIQNPGGDLIGTGGESGRKESSKGGYYYSLGWWDPYFEKDEHDKWELKYKGARSRFLTREQYEQTKTGMEHG